MKKLNKITSLLIIISLPVAALAWIPDVYIDTVMVIDNKTNSAIFDKVSSINRGTMMTKAPNPIQPGKATFENDGDTFFLPGFALDIGDNQHPSGVCKVRVNYGNEKATITQQADGSNGFICVKTSGYTIELRKSSTVS